MGKEGSTPRSFAVFLQSVRDGELHGELSEAQHGLIAKLEKAAAAGGKAKGSITLVLNFDLDARGVVEVTSDVKTKEPKLERGRAVFWLDADGHLLSENPKQQKLPIRDVSAPAAAREVPSAAAEVRTV